MTSEPNGVNRFRKSLSSVVLRYHLLALVALALPGLALATEPSGVVAETPSPAPNAAEGRRPRIDPSLRSAVNSLLARAREHYDAAELPGADTRAELERALDVLGLVRSIAPGPELLFNLAQVHGRWGDCDRARALYQQVLDAAPSSQLRTHAEKGLAKLEECDAQAAESSAAAPLSEGRELEPALHLPASWRLAADLPLASVALPVEEPAARGDAEGWLGWAPARAWPWALGSLAVLAGATATGYWWRAVSLKNELDGREAGPEVPRIQERGRNAQNTALVWSGLSAAFALGAAGSYLWLYQPEQRAPADASGVSWWVVEGGGGLTYRARF